MTPSANNEGGREEVEVEVGDADSYDSSSHVSPDRVGGILVNTLLINSYCSILLLNHKLIEFNRFEVSLHLYK